MTTKQFESLKRKRETAQRRERIAMAEGLFEEVDKVETPIKLPPDPEELNDDRAEWAEAAVIEFIAQTGVDELDSAVGDLLADLMHLCDRIGLEFDTCLDMGRNHYHEETLPDEPDPDDVRKDGGEALNTTTDSETSVRSVRGVRLHPDIVRDAILTAEAETQAIERVFTLVYPHFERLKSIDGYITCNEATWKRICQWFIELTDRLNRARDLQKQHQLGGAWMNWGFSVHEPGARELADWQVVPAPTTPPS